ncbi:MAG: chitobiase/beta-hexosaminidase C-terminal domain-containing protein [Clostridium sp.]|nr:chitobiase/beta-hexosaminidase C-terminal domain-containing protein [Clostridium sp.]
MKVAYSEDGVNYESLSFSSESKTAWQSVACTAELPAVDNLYLRIQIPNIGSGHYVYIDDLRITAEQRLNPYEPEFSLPSGVVYVGQQVLLSCKTPEASIYYTMDGSEPDETSFLYENPIELTESCTLKAIAIAGVYRSKVVEAKYEYLPFVDVASLEELVAMEEGCLVRFPLNGLYVTAMGENEVVMQNETRGLLVQTEQWTIPVGYYVEGTLIGTVQGNGDYVVITEANLSGVTQGMVVSVIPEVVSLVDLLDEGYMLRLVKLDDVGIQDGCVAQDGHLIPLVDCFGKFSADYEWPEQFSLTCISMYEEDKLVLAPLTVTSSASEESPILLGTALVARYTDNKSGEATDYAAVAEVNSNKALNARKVTLLADAVLVSMEEEAPAIAWMIENGRITSSNGKYLGSATTTGTNINLHDNYSKELCAWGWDESDGYWSRTIKDDGKRTLLYDKSYGIKLYLATNQNTAGYSDIFRELPIKLGYTRSVLQKNFATVCLPYAVDCTQVPDCRFYSLTGKMVDADGLATELVLEGPLKRLEAGYPYLFICDNAQLRLMYTGSKVDAPYEHNGLVGTFEAINPDKDLSDASLEGHYVLAANNVVGLCAAGSSLGANRAYINMSRVPVCEERPLEGLSLPMVEVPTHITDATAEPNATQAKIYTLQGICVGEGENGNLPSGIYIKDGKKIVISCK